MPRLIVTNGPLIGRRYELGDTLALEAGAMVRVAGDAVTVEDVDSPGGTWVDGHRIERPTALVDGSQLRVGETIYIVEIDAPDGMRARTRAGFPALTGPAAAASAPPALRSSPPPAATYEPPPLPHHRRADSRMWLPAAATFAAIIATAVALVVYFALR